MKYRLSQLATLVEGKLIGEDIEVMGVDIIERANDEVITFARDIAHLKKFLSSKAKAAVVSKKAYESFVDNIKGKFTDKSFILVENAEYAFSVLVDLFDPVEHPVKVIEREASIAKTAKLEEGVAVGKNTVVLDNVHIGEGTIIYPLCFIGENVKIGKNCVIYPNVVIRENVVIGDNVIIHSGTVIGSDGYGYTVWKGKHRKIPQRGTVVIGDDVEIGANVCIDRGTLGNTEIGNGTKIDNLVHIAHNVKIGENCLVVAQVGISGSVQIGNWVTLAGQSGVAGHLKIGDGAVITARAGVIGDIEAGTQVSGFPAREHYTYFKELAVLKRLVDMYPEIVELVKRKEKKDEKK